MQFSNWLAVITDRAVFDSTVVETWWCLPESARAGDLVYLYCPRSANSKLQGVFGLATVVEAPSKRHTKNAYCSGFGHPELKLLYCELRITKRFENRLSASDIKSVNQLSRELFVRRNFQGTSFKVSDLGAATLLTLLNVPISANDLTPD